ncbi:MAG: hypothetical protein FWF00_00085 [Endomicrobia bacterium]|nr:hypothetical protein [Endomicrobiia bacterium]MCL2506076.1 hypothetical protein [Endomicrobiia bacterium]
MINVSAIQIPYKALLARLGYLQAKTKIDKKTEILIKENLDLAQKLIKPKAVLAFDNITVKNGIIELEDGFKIESSDITKLLDGCFKAYCIAVTIGQAIENKRNSFIDDKETFKALILDAAGSVAAEETISIAYRQIEDFEKKNGNVLTKRYSPGYGNWKLESQKDFLNWLGADKIGITLNDFFLMRPEKSVSALIGVKRQ